MVGNGTGLETGKAVRVLLFVCMGVTAGGLGHEADAELGSPKRNEDSVIRENLRDHLPGYLEQHHGFRESIPGWREYPLGYRDNPPGYRAEPIGYMEFPMQYVETPVGFSEKPLATPENDESLRIPKDQLASQTVSDKLSEKPPVYQPKHLNDTKKSGLRDDYVGF